ncbi:MAG: SDR family oxidoreductase [Bacteroidetes bacterium]|nr:SDR family oxidoreductase [Bacteroidota bacterium]
MRYLVTGGAGFIGSNIVKELLSRGKVVRVLDNFSTGKRENLDEFKSNPSFELIEGDLRSYHTVRYATDGIDFVLHQGALPSVPRSINDPITTNEVNISGTLNILEASKDCRVKRVVFASSSSVYGNSETLPKVEGMAVAPLSPYALTKYAAERYCQIYFQLYRLETVCLRYFNVFGPNQDPTSQYSAVIPKFIKLIKEGKEPMIYGDGLQSRDFTYVTNNVNANILACEAEGVAGEVFNIACGEKYSLLDLLEKINVLTNNNISPNFKEGRKGEVKHSIADIEKAKSILGFKPIINFDEGLKKTIECF